MGDKEVPEKPDESSLLMTDAQKMAVKKEWIVWLSGDQAVMGCIKAACEDVQLPSIIECKALKEMWAQLKTVHQMNELQINIHYFFEELYTWKYMDRSSMADYIVAMLDLKHQIEQAGEKLTRYSHCSYHDYFIAENPILGCGQDYSLFEVTKLTSEIISLKLWQEANHHYKSVSLLFTLGFLVQTNTNGSFLVVLK